MQHLPIFLDTREQRIVLAGGGAAALAKLRLLFKTEAHLVVASPDPAPEIMTWAREGRLTLLRRRLEAGDLEGARLVYAADDAPEADARTAALGRAAGALVNVVDTPEACDFITPAMVDRDPVTVAIGTEGAAPVLARAIKADLEARLPVGLGPLARIAKDFRRVAEALPQGPRRRAFWQAYFDEDGPRALPRGEDAVRDALDRLLHRHLDRAPRPGHVSFVGAGPGDPELLPLKARRALDSADVVLHDRLVPAAILDLARREAQIVDVGKTGFGPATAQAQINALLVAHGADGARVVRLKGGDCTIFGRLDEEIEAVTAAQIAYDIVPGITAASAAVAAIGQSLTRRGRNASVRILTGHDMQGFAEQDWRSLARPGEVAAIYMGKRAARFLQGRLLMHGAAPETPVTLVENAARPEQRLLSTTLDHLTADLEAAALDGPALMLFGLAPRRAAQTLQEIPTWPAPSHPRLSPPTPSSQARSST